MYQPLIKFHPHPAIFTQVLRIFADAFRTKTPKRPTTLFEGALPAATHTGKAAGIVVWYKIET